MARGIEIVDVQLGPPETREDLSSEKWVEVSIKVKNHYKTRRHLISGVRSLNYDSESKTLEVALSEPELPPGFRPSSFMMPPMQTVDTGKSTTLKVFVPLVIKELVPGEGKGLKIKELDISDVENVHCKLSFDTKKFRPDVSASPEEMNRQLCDWGRTEEKTLSCSLPRPSQKTKGRAKRTRKQK